MAKRLKDIGLRDEEELSSEEVSDMPIPIESARKPPPKDVAAPEFEVSKLHHGQLEFITLVRVVMDNQLQSRLWPRLTEEHFAADTTKAIYKRLQTLHQSGRDWPKLATLAKDPALPASALAQLNTVVSRADKGKPLTHGNLKLSTGLNVPLESVSDFEGFVFDLLDSYRITRTAAEKFVDAISTIADNDSFDPLMGPEIVEKAATEVLSVRGQESITDALLHFGHQTTDEDAAKRKDELRRMMQADLPRFKIGIENFDKKAGGFQAGEVVLLGANTGGGKTAAALSMMTNMARLGTSVAMLQLELSLQQIDERLSCHLADVSSDVVRSGRIPPKTQTVISQAWEDFHDECKLAGSRFTIFAPSSQTVSGCEMVFKQFPYRVWFIDYVNLIDLGGKDDRLQGWEKLSRVTKLFKSLAKKYSICVVLLVQVNIDGDGNIEVRYAKAMKEDADIALAWNLTREAKEEGVVWWQHLKARQYEPFDFPVRAELEYYRFSSFREESIESKKKRLGKKRTKKKDPIDEAVDAANSTFQKKEKPLIVDDDRPLVDAALAGDLHSKAPVNKISFDDEDEEYEGFDDEE